MRLLVVGGGILGIAAAELLTRERSGDEIVVLEREDRLAVHQTGHNSGVVHAGIYYAPGSLKARLCRRGGELLRAFCAEHGLTYDSCGKLVIAEETGEIEGLRRLEERAGANGVPGLRWLDESGLRQIEPHARGVAALHSPTSAIVDFGAVTRALGDHAVARGATIRTAAGVTRISAERDSIAVELAAGEVLRADRVLVCAGLWADRLARRSGESAEPRIVPFRGEYWKLRPERTGLVGGLIYPVPDPRLPFLGVHLTRKVDGEVWIGPNAVLALARDGYRRRRIVPRDVADTLGWPGTWRMMARHWRSGVGELQRSASKRAFVRDARRYVPELEPADVERASAGVRAQALDRDGTLVDDFRLSRAGRVVWVRNAPSPAATSSMAIAEELCERLLTAA
ncbi:MAG TPA: L-2-hydroxyglutarate oxidase [Solirubrobacteraceae bacterium]|jgi:L-2-hydroxyglutarate oxidase LhgO|nr:L-2-hydroxyglutarate oxidase [Solirubrobacteraceae bacterium]